MKTFKGLDELAAAAGAEFGSTDWLLLDQQRVGRFADATEDHQWIHVDPARAAAGPFGGPIAHGLLTLSLLPYFQQQLYRVEGTSMTINYGFGRVRFPSPVPVGSRIRAGARLLTTEPVAGGLQATFETLIEVEGSPKPACVAESIARYLA